MPKVPYPYEVNGKLVTRNGSLIPIRSLSNRSLLPSLTVYLIKIYNFDPLYNPFCKRETHRDQSSKGENDAEHCLKCWLTIAGLAKC